MSDRIRTLYNCLSEDRWRGQHPFTEDLAAVQDVLWGRPFHPDERFASFSRWLRSANGQPCIFGRIAAKLGRLHVCLLDEATLLGDDADIEERLHTELRQWKHRAIGPPHFDRDTMPHGFLLLAHSTRLANAAPDMVLYNLALELRRLWGCAVEREAVADDDLAWETLYIKDADGNYRRFRFTVDFFAAQGDGRWWHDHRIPGGIGFTANSAGHMAYHRRDYLGEAGDQGAWLAKNAMMTIDKAATTPYGQATWLRPLDNGAPLVPNLPCPFAPPVPTGLEGKDWTRYHGHLFSDHSIRRALFRSEPEKPTDTQREQLLQEFDYLYSPRNPSYDHFAAGEVVTEAEVWADIGHPSTLRSISIPKGVPRFDHLDVRWTPEEEAERIAAFARLDLALPDLGSDP